MRDLNRIQTIIETIDAAIEIEKNKEFDDPNDNAISLAIQKTHSEGTVRGLKIAKNLLKQEVE